MLWRRRVILCYPFVTRAMFYRKNVSFPITTLRAFEVTKITEKSGVFWRKIVIHSYPKMDNEKNAEKNTKKKYRNIFSHRKNNLHDYDLNCTFSGKRPRIFKF